MYSPLRVLFFGTAKLACPTLAAILRDPAFTLVAVVTQPDRPQGRELKLKPSPVKTLALQSGIAVFQPGQCRDPAFVDQVRAAQPDLIVVAAYGQILPPALLDLPKHGCLNVHASLLPRHRGAAPIQWAILQGDAETGVTIMRMDPGLDTGDILSQRATPVCDADDAPTLHDRLAAMGAALLIESVPDYVAGRLKPRPQPAEGVTHARKITKGDGRLDWNQPATVLWRRVRAFVPWPGAYTFVICERRPLLLKLWCASAEPAAPSAPGTVISADHAGLLIACGEGALRVFEIQREGGRRLPASEFLAGNPLHPGMKLGSHLNI